MKSPFSKVVNTCSVLCPAFQKRAQEEQDFQLDFEHPVGL